MAWACHVQTHHGHTVCKRIMCLAYALHQQSAISMPYPLAPRSKSIGIPIYAYPIYAYPIRIYAYPQPYSISVSNIRYPKCLSTCTLTSGMPCLLLSHAITPLSLVARHALYMPCSLSHTLLSLLSHAMPCTCHVLSHTHSSLSRRTPCPVSTFPLP